MPKTIFPNAKTMTVGGVNVERPRDKTPSETPGAAKSTYESHGASKWKAMTGSVNDLFGGTPPPDPFGLGPATQSQNELGDFFAAFGDNVVKPAIGLDSAPVPQGPAAPFVSRLTRFTGKEYKQFFEEPKNPPSFTKAIALFPNVDKELKGTIVETRAFYNDRLSLFLERMTNATKAIHGGRLSPYQLTVTRQFVARLEEAISFTEKQIETLDEFERHEFGGEGNI